MPATAKNWSRSARYALRVWDEGGAEQPGVDRPAFGIAEIARHPAAGESGDRLGRHGHELRVLCCHLAAHVHLRATPPADGTAWFV
jgi:hypothetical protein